MKPSWSFGGGCVLVGLALLLGHEQGTRSAPDSGELRPVLSNRSSSQSSPPAGFAPARGRKVADVNLQLLLPQVLRRAALMNTPVFNALPGENLVKDERDWIADVDAQIRALNDSQLEALIAMVRASKAEPFISANPEEPYFSTGALPAVESSQNIVATGSGNARALSSLLEVLARRDPQRAFELVAEIARSAAPQSTGNSERNEILTYEIQSGDLGGLNRIASAAASKDLDAAMDWYAAHRISFACDSSGALHGIMQEGARQHLPQALDRAARLDPAESSVAAGGIAASTQSVGDRVDLIHALHQLDLPENSPFALEVLRRMGMQAAAQDGGKVTTGWLETLDLSPAEKGMVREGILVNDLACSPAHGSQGQRLQLQDQIFPE